MERATGQILRRFGLLVETICLLGLVSVARDPQQPARTFAGLSVFQWLTFGLVIGFILWFTGTAAIYLKRKPREAERPEGEKETSTKD
jgi:hypothetical protein